MGMLDRQAENIRDNFSDSAVFQPAVGDPVTLQVEFTEEDEAEPVGGEGQMEQVRREITFLKADLAAEPARDETFTIDGTEYKVKFVTNRDRWFLTVAVK